MLNHSETTYIRIQTPLKKDIRSFNLKDDQSVL